MPPRPRPLLTLDIGVTYDHCVLTLWWRLAGVSALNGDHDGRPVFAVQVHVFPQGTPLIDVVNATIAVIERTRPAYVAIERSGVGAMPAQEVERTIRRRMPRERMKWCAIHWSSEMKLSAYSLLRWLFERGQIVLRRDPVPLRQLAGIRVETASRGARIGAEDRSVHDDVADALAFGALPYVARGGRIVCGLAALAELETAPPEAEVPALDAPMTSTIAGLRLYERPPLQGVADTTLWLPPGAVFKDEINRPRAEMVAAPEPRNEEVR